jgi:uncharacterized phiE125 gp8 family phage protein
MSAALTTLDDVRAQLNMDDTVTDHDTLLEQLIVQATGAIQRHTGCEFVSAAHDGQDPIEDVARRFPYTGGAFLHLSPFDATSITSVQLDPDSASPVTLADDEYRLWPVSSRDGEIHTIELLASAATYGGPTRIVEVTGRWGWPQVPAEVKQAAEAVVVHWYRVHAQNQQGYSADVDRYGPVAFPTMARMLLEPFRMRRGI